MHTIRFVSFCPFLCLSAVVVEEAVGPWVPFVTWISSVVAVGPWVLWLSSETLGFLGRRWSFYFLWRLRLLRSFRSLWRRGP